MLSAVSKTDAELVSVEKAIREMDFSASKPVQDLPAAEFANMDTRKNVAAESANVTDVQDLSVTNDVDMATSVILVDAANADVTNTAQDQNAGNSALSAVNGNVTSTDAGTVYVEDQSVNHQRARPTANMVSVVRRIDTAAKSVFVDSAKRSNAQRSANTDTLSELINEVA